MDKCDVPAKRTGELATDLGRAYGHRLLVDRDENFVDTHGSLTSIVDAEMIVMVSAYIFHGERHRMYARRFDELVGLEDLFRFEEWSPWQIELGSKKPGRQEVPTTDDHCRFHRSPGHGDISRDRMRGYSAVDGGCAELAVLA
jgi:hypothetical protein